MAFSTGFVGAAGRRGVYEPYWMTTYGGARDDVNEYIAIDSLGNKYTYGTTSLYWTANDDKPYSTLIKYSPEGTFLWSFVVRKTADRSSGSSSRGFAIDSNDDIYLLCSEANSPYEDVLIKLDSSGSVIWQKSLGGADESPRDISVGTTGAVYVTGASSDSGSYSNVYILKYDTNGTQLWQRYLDSSFYGNEATYAYSSIATDSLENIYVNITDNYKSKMFLVKLNSSGTLQWQRLLTPPNTGPYDDNFARDLVVDSSDNVILSVDLDGLSSAVKVDSNGSLLWAMTMGGVSTSIRGSGVALDSSDNIYLNGYYFDYDDAARKYILLSAKLSPQGGLYWARALVKSPYGHDSRGSAVALDSSDNLYLAGFTSAQQSGRLVREDAFLGKFPNDGSLTGTYYYDSDRELYSTKYFTPPFVLNASSVTLSPSSLTLGTPTLADSVSTFVTTSNSDPLNFLTI